MTLSQYVGLNPQVVAIFMAILRLQVARTFVISIGSDPAHSIVQRMGFQY
jgi:hypothetical protein